MRSEYDITVASSEAATIKQVTRMRQSNKFSWLIRPNLHGGSGRS